MANTPQLLVALESASTARVLTLTHDELSQTLEWLFPEERELHAELEVVVLQIAESHHWTRTPFGSVHGASICQRVSRRQRLLPPPLSAGRSRSRAR